MCIRDRQFCVRCAEILCTAKHGIDPLNQDSKLEGLGDIVVAAHIQPHNDTRFFVRSGQKDDRHLGNLPHPFAKFKAGAEMCIRDRKSI